MGLRSPWGRKGSTSLRPLTHSRATCSTPRGQLSPPSCRTDSEAPLPSEAPACARPTVPTLSLLPRPAFQPGQLLEAL